MLDIDYPEPSGRCCAADIDARIAENLAWTEALWEEGRAAMTRRQGWTAALLYSASTAVAIGSLLVLIPNLIGS